MQKYPDKLFFLGQMSTLDGGMQSPLLKSYEAYSAIKVTLTPSSSEDEKNKYLLAIMEGYSISTRESADIVKERFFRLAASLTKKEEKVVADMALDLEEKPAKK